jgi:hypothetical protein
VDNIDHIHPRNRHNFTKCAKCSTWFDTRDLDKELHHETGACTTGQPVRTAFMEQGGPMSRAEYKRWLKAAKKKA